MPGGNSIVLFDREKTMRQAYALLAIVAAMASTPSFAQMKLTEGTTIVFASVEEAKQVLTSRDPFVQGMSPFDRAARLQTDKPVSEKEYLAFVAENILPWQPAERRKISAAFQSVQKALEALSLPLPEKVLVIKTTGDEEGDAPYTRANAIILPKSMLRARAGKITQILCHELFHIMSRANPALQEKLYGAIGFVKCAEVAFPPKLKPRKLTNPDAPRNDHCVHIQVEGQDHWAIPILFSKTETYDLRKGGHFFHYLQFRLLLVERAENSDAVTPLYEGEQPRLIDVPQASGFHEQIGKNTRYIIHPEEILADNFAFLVLGKPNLPSPEIVERLEKILKAEAGT